MSDESSVKKSNQDSELMEQAKQLLHLTEIVEAYPEVVGRRVTGILYLLIGGGTSLVTLVFMSLMIFVDNLGDNLLVILGFVVLSLMVAWFMTVKMIRPLTKSYPSELQEEMSTASKVVWGTIAVIMVVSAIVLFSINQIILFAIVIQFLLMIGNALNYFDAKKSNDETPSNIHIYYALAIGLGLVPMFLFPSIAFPLMIVVDMGGLYAIGIYMLISAESILLEKTGRQ